jgi:hypothetical protein
MDDAERAELHEQMFRDIALGQRKPTLMPAMRCYYCDESIARGLLFCPGGACAQDWEHENRIRQIIGRTQGHS